jgi:hypothetical protein
VFLAFHPRSARSRFLQHSGKIGSLVLLG